ncbi:MAG: KOW domain-containing RNA-binding protein [Firmicutes bacterium]|nr:KOW domain-containing RNA-binding protein [Bacillota bacterium]
MVDLKVGQLVVSRAGRDAGTEFLVVKILDGGAVLVADGRRRCIANPKRKNVKHLWVTGRVAPEIARMVASGEPITDADLRSCLQGLKESVQEEVG